MHVTKIKLYVSYVLLMCTGINRKIGCLYVYMHMCGFIQNVKHFVTYKIIIAIISFVTPLILISSGNHGDFRKSSCFQNLLRLLCWKAITAFFLHNHPYWHDYLISWYYCIHLRWHIIVTSIWSQIASLGVLRCRAWSRGESDGEWSDGKLNRWHTGWWAEFLLAGKTSHLQKSPWINSKYFFQTVTKQFLQWIETGLILIF